MDISEIAAPVQQHLNDFETEFSQKFHSSVPLVDKIITYIITKKGKRLRPMLVFLTTKLHGEVTQKTMYASLAIEMFHTATLIHDDVVDESDLRRGSQTVNNIWDNKISILVGDLLFAKTLSSIVNLNDHNALAILSLAAEKITEGELLQIACTNEGELSEEEYINLISKKTAALFSASCQMGALAAENNELLDKMENFGEYLGIAFQITDDILDYFGKSEEMGKPIGNDLKEGKITLPLIYALNNTSDKNRQRILNKLDNGECSESDIEEIVSFTKKAGGLEYSNKVAENYAKKAQTILNTYPDSDIKQSLTNLVNFAVNRDK